ncbi:bacteriohopanetetrol glucosamine biosynthesis glycosyltransferase HpnI [Bradyrhizobium sp. STM 3562]|uniref:bacteriohopanetetrol glucosamine biosynthesis glycosyltransferase HpnI n=1 Tax=Bradyrhizobium sp. STM 3562 TaxID=578924 RepID=UPI00388E3CF7
MRRGSRSNWSELKQQIGSTTLMLSLHENISLLAELCVAGATLGILYNLVAALLVLRFGNPAKPTVSKLPRVSILKPLHGAEPGLYPRLTTFCQQDYPEEVQLICGTQQADDQAIHTVRLVKKLNPAAQIDLIVDERSRGTNRKVGNLVNMEPRVRHEVVVLSDSDILVDNHFLRRIAAELESRKAGAVTCVYYGVGLRGIWARLSAANINCQLLPNVIVALSFGAARPCFGSAIALRAETLKQIGGLVAFADELADDYAIGKAVRALGKDVVITRWAVGHACFDRSFRAFWEHHMRSARTIRSIDPIGYVGLLFMHPLMLSVLAACAGTPHSLVLITSALSARAILSTSVESTFGLQRQSFWLLALHDAISFAVYVCSFFGNSVTWRGYNFHIQRNGTIETGDLIPEPRRSED